MVTATSDVEVEPPRYSPAEDDEPEDTTTASSTTTTATKQSATSATTAVTDASATTVIATPTDSATSATETTTGTTIMHDCVMPEEGGTEDAITVPGKKPFPLIPVLGIGGGVILVIGAIVIWILLVRKK